MFITSIYLLNIYKNLNNSLEMELTIALVIFTARYGFKTQSWYALRSMLCHVSRARSNYASSCRLPYACLSIPAPVIGRGRSVSIHFIDLTAASAGRATFYFFS